MFCDIPHWWTNQARIDDDDDDCDYGDDRVGDRHSCNRNRNPNPNPPSMTGTPPHTTSWMQFPWTPINRDKGGATPKTVPTTSSSSSSSTMTTTTMRTTMRTAMAETTPGHPKSEDQPEWILLEEEETPEPFEEKNAVARSPSDRHSPPSAIKSLALDFDSVATAKEKAPAGTARTTTASTAATTAPVSLTLRLVVLLAVLVSLLLANHPGVIPARVARALPPFLRPTAPCCDKHKKAARSSTAPAAAVPAASTSKASPSLMPLAARPPHGGTTDGGATAPPLLQTLPLLRNLQKDAAAAAPDAPAAPETAARIAATPLPTRTTSSSSSLSKPPARTEKVPQATAAAATTARPRANLAATTASLTPPAASAVPPSASSVDCSSMDAWGKLRAGPGCLSSLLGGILGTAWSVPSSASTPKVQFFPELAGLSEKARGVRSHVHATLKAWDGRLRGWAAELKRHKEDRRRTMRRERERMGARSGAAKRQGQPRRRRNA